MLCEILSKFSNFFMAAIQSLETTMQSPLFDGVGSTYGTYRVLPPLQEAHTPKNSSHIQELYQNLPQLPKPFHLPVSYKSYEPHNNLLDPYSEQRQVGLSSPPSFLYAKLQPSNNHISKPRYPKHHSEQELENNQQMMYKRNGWGWDAGHGHHGHQQKHGNTPALSALALLGFMFFLNLIQNSLQNNRQMLAAAALNATTVSVVAGRDNPYGYRFKRGIKDENKYTMPLSIPSLMARDGHSNIGKTGPKKEKSYNEYRVKFIPGSNSQNSSSSSSNKMEKELLNSKLQPNPFEILKSSSVHCCQLVACKLGESIYDSLDTTTGFMIRMLGSTMITRVPRKTWTGKLLRALDKGWKKESCDHLFRNCGVLYKLFHNATNGGPVRRRRKY